MIKRILTLVVVSSVISAGLLYLGITLMGKYSPALASSLNALVAGTTEHTSPNTFAAVEDAPQAADISTGGNVVDISAAPNTASNPPVDYTQSLKTSDNSMSAEKSSANVTIAQLFNNPEQYRNQVITLNGIANSLGNDKVLLNDGTGQILVEVEDDLLNIAVINGLSISVMAKLDDFSSPSVFELDACTLQYQNDIVVIDDCSDDDDMNDDDDDDMNDDDDDGMNDDDGTHDDDDDGMDDDDDNGMDDDDDNGMDDDDDNGMDDDDDDDDDSDDDDSDDDDSDDDDDDDDD